MRTNKTRFFAAVIAVIMCLSLLPTAFYAEDGDLTVSTVEEFVAFRDAVNGGNTFEGKTVTLNANLALEGSWLPVGTSSAPFCGTFDGGYHYISGLSVSGGSEQGLFGVVKGGTVKNLVVRGAVKGTSNVGGIVGKLDGAKIENCMNSASVSGGSAVGGIVGYVNGACVIEGCVNTGSVSGTTGYIGGVSGQHWRAGEVRNCYNTGRVSGPATVGGVVGGHKASTSVVENCFNAGAVVDTAGYANNIGGVLGANRGTCANCFVLSGYGDATKGATAADTLDASTLGSAFENGETLPVLAWEKNISTANPVKAGFVEKTALSAELASYIRAAVESAKKRAGVTDTMLGNPDYLSGASSTATDWLALGMGRFASDDGKTLIDDGNGYDAYLDAMKTYIETTYAENGGKLHRVKATEWHRAVVTIAALGGDPTSFGTYNGAPIDLIADGSYNCVISRGPGAQGLNGWIWGLIAMDVTDTVVPANAKYPRERFITEILKTQLTDGVNGNDFGGWVLGGYGSSSDVDMTAMALQSLAPYYNDETVYTYTNAASKTEVSRTVRECVNDALDRLGSMMNENAGFTSWNTENSESIAQVIVALCALGIDPAKDERFITESGKTLLDGILEFRTDDGGFGHTLSTDFNSMANDQATYALVSYWRFENELRSLYDMRLSQSDPVKATVSAAVEAINNIPSPTDENYKAAVKTALEALRTVPETERTYVRNGNALFETLDRVGGENNLDNSEKYIVGIEVTAPAKTEYEEGESLDTAGMTVTAVYSDGSREAVNDYKLLVSDPLDTDTSSFTVRVGVDRVTIAIKVNEKMPWSGTGTESDPYIIATADELCAISDKIAKGYTFRGKFFKMTSDVDLADRVWTPIGTSRTQFDGTFDGDGHKIENLTSPRNGLFGYAGTNSVIKNVGVASGTIGSPDTYLSWLGGIVGWSNGADIINCRNGATVYASGYSGGIVGTVRDGGKSVIEGCYNVGSVVGKDTGLGGIVGHIDTTREQGGTNVEVTVRNCYNIGSVSGVSAVGGIVGKAQDGHTFENCYNAGDVTCSSEKYVAGGICGETTYDNTFTNCFFDTAKTSVGDNTDKTVGKTFEELRSDETMKLLGDAFRPDVCGVNGGLPVLAWQITTLYGDVNFDNEVDITDAMLVFYHVAKKEALPETALAVADFNADGETDIADAMKLFYFVAKKSTSLFD
mgnify:FL=1